MNKMRPVSFLKWLRFHTTFFLHMKAHKNSWYREWHRWRFSHHFHVAMLTMYIVSIIFGSLGAFFTTMPQSALASTVYEWDMNTPSEYTYNPAEIEFTGGVTQPLGTYSVLGITTNAVFCTDANTCYFMGNDGDILKSTDGGASFADKSSGMFSWQDIYCTDATTCYAVATHSVFDGNVSKTINGGETWESKLSDSDPFYGVNFIGDTGYAVGHKGTIWKTVNGGTNWTDQTQGVAYKLESIDCTDADTCYAVGWDGVIIKTVNGGTDWDAQDSGTTSHLQRIYCTNADTCYAVGYSGTILKTVDGGINWTSQNSGTTQNIEGVYFTGSNTGYAGGDNGTILKTTNGGTTWNNQNTSIGVYLNALHCPNTDTCYTGGYDGHLKTINGGSNWTTIHYQPMPTVTPNTSQTYSIITGFQETLGTGSIGTVYYQLSNNDGVSWYWYNNGGATWEVATNDYHRNTASEVNTNIPTFTGSLGSGTGEFKWKAIFHGTSASEQQKLDSVKVSIKGVSPNAPQSLEITDVSNREKEVWALALTWDAPLAGGGDIDFYKIERSDNGGPWQEVGTTTDGTRRAYAEMVASSSVTYSYRVRAVDHDELGGLYDDESGPSNTVSMVPTGKYPNLPTLFGTPSVSVSATTASITWSTERPSSSAVKYSTDTSYGLIVSDNQTEVTSHSVALKGLLPGTAYHYKIQSLDPERTYGDNTYYSTDYTFTTTLAAEISNLKITDIRSDSALLSWQTTANMAPTVHYGKTVEYGLTVAASAGTNHGIRLTGLESSATYHFKIIGNDTGGNLVQSDDYSFETLAFPKISNVKFEPVKDKPKSTLKVIWDTNVPASSIVEYSDNTGVKQSTSDYQLLTKHEIIISGLKDKTDYLMTVKGRDGLGNEVSSEGHKVTTELDTRAPEISEITTETSIEGYGSGAKAQLIVSWTTDEPATSQVEHSKGASGKKLDLTTQEDTSLTTSHAVVISDLKPSTPYYFKIVTKDKSGNEAKSEVKSALTGQARLSIFDIVLKSFESTLGWLFGAEGLK